MSATAAVVLFIVGPLIGWVALLSLRWNAFGKLRQEALSRGLVPPETGRLVTVVGYSATPVVLGTLIWILSRASTEAVDAGSTPSAVSLDLVLIWSGIAYLAASYSMVVSQEVLLRARFSAIFSEEMGRILVLHVIPLTAVIFALVLDLTILGAIDAILRRGLSLSSEAVDSVVRALGAFSLGTLAFPVAAFASKGVRDLSGRRFARALLVLEAGELPVLLGLVMTLSAVASL